MFWIKSCEPYVWEGDAAEMTPALNYLCQHFCSTGLSVFASVCVCVYIFLQYSECKS